MTHICACELSPFNCVQLFVTLWSVACQTPLSLGFSRQEYGSGFPCLPPGDLPDPGIKPISLASPSLEGSFFTTSTTWEARKSHTHTHTHTHTHGYHSKWILQIWRLTLSTEIHQCPRGPSCDSHWLAASQCCRSELTGSQSGQELW